MKASDFVYQVEDTKSGDMFHAGWDAVWGPFCDRVGYSAVDAQRCWDRVRRLWHGRLEGLRQAGWEPALNDSTLTYMRNCPPFGVRTNRAFVHPCHRDKLCPFCWGRHAMQVYARVSRAIYPAARAPCPKRTRLLYFVHAQLLEAEGPRPSHEELAGHLRATRNLEVRHFPRAQGSFVLQTIEHQPGQLLLKRRGLILAQHPLPPFEGMEVCQEIHRPTRDELSVAVSTVCRYPARQMFCPEDKLILLMGLAKHYRLRLSGFKGTLRK